MKTFRILAILATAVGGVALSSCGCATGEERPPKLRTLPQFNNVPAPPVIDDAK